MELHRSGCAGKLTQVRNSGIPIIGICGGYQMLGRELHDSGVESREGIYPGLGFLNGVTTFIGYDKRNSTGPAQGQPGPPDIVRNKRGKRV